MKRNRGRKPEYQIRIAKERIAVLFSEAGKAAAEDKKLAKRYVELAKKIGMRYNVRMPAAFRRRYCRYCCNLLLGARYRLKRGAVVIKCPSCSRTIRYPYKNKRHV